MNNKSYEKLLSMQAMIDVNRQDSDEKLQSSQKRSQQ